MAKKYHCKILIADIRKDLFNSVQDKLQSYGKFVPKNRIKCHMHLLRSCKWWFSLKFDRLAEKEKPKNWSFYPQCWNSHSEKGTWNFRSIIYASVQSKLNLSNKNHQINHPFDLRWTHRHRSLNYCNGSRRRTCFNIRIY